MPLRVGLVAGESSGDLLGAGLIEALKKRRPDAVFEGVAGPHMIEAGCERWADAEQLAIMGLIEPLKHLPELLSLRRSLIARWRSSPPDVFVGIDAPDFNLGLETRLKAAGIRTMHYVSPTIWAWRAGRIRKIRKAADCVLCILPFEPAIYEEHGMSAVFVGHPKADTLSADTDVHAARQALGISGSGRVVAVMPGSRAGEVSRLAPIFAAAAVDVAAQHDDVQFVTPVARPKLQSLIEQELERHSIHDRFTVVEGRSIECMAAADLVLLASGTAALESALLGKPTVAAYRVAWLTFKIVMVFNLVKVDRVTLPNLLTGEMLIPEFIQDDATPQAVSAEVISLLDDRERRDGIRSKFAKLHDELALDANERAADALIRLVEAGPTGQ